MAQGNTGIELVRFFKFFFTCTRKGIELVSADSTLCSYGIG